MSLPFNSNIFTGSMVFHETSKLNVMFKPVVQSASLMVYNVNRVKGLFHFRLLICFVTPAALKWPTATCLLTTLQHNTSGCSTQATQLHLDKSLTLDDECDGTHY